MPQRVQDVQRNLLMVSGEFSVLDSLCSGLTSRGYMPTPAASGIDALELLRQKPFGTIVVDFSISGMSPLQFIEASHRMHPQVAIFALLRGSDLDKRQMAIGFGACDTCIYPVAVEELDAVIRRRLLSQAVLSNRLSSVRAEVLQKAIKAIASAVDVKMRFTSQHSANVTDMCLAMAIEMRFSPEQMDLMELAAQIHDIGMVAVADDVVAKPYQLDDLEWVDVLKHPALGSAMLAGVPELAEVAAAIRHHHERMDGQGYPDGLYGDAIPLLARMIAVADAYESMTSERPHRPALSHELAVVELRRNAGTQFDDNIVELLVSVLDGSIESEERKVA